MRTTNRKSEKLNQTPADPFLTEGKFNELKDKLERLKTVSRPRATNEVARLAEMGDFSENVAYQMAKGRLRGMNNAIARLEYQLDHAVIIAPPKEHDVVQIGHTITLESNGRQKTYTILGSTETDPSSGVISHTSPLGAALLGHAVGETVTVVLKDREVQYRIIKIE